MKKILPLVLCSLLLVGCNNSPVPEDIKSFINGINFNVTYKTLKEGVFSQSYVETLKNVEAGTNSIEFTFSQDEDNFNYHALYTYGGNQIKDNVTSKEVTMKFISQDLYIREVKINSMVSETKQMNYEDAHAYWYTIFDSGKNSYRFGGLYYGDFFAINMNSYYNLYSLNKDKNTITVKETGAVYIEGIFLDQEIEMDSMGMLLYKKEHAYDASRANGGMLIQNASYIY